MTCLPMLSNMTINNRCNDSKVFPISCCGSSTHELRSFSPKSTSAPTLRTPASGRFWWSLNGWVNTISRLSCGLELLRYIYCNDWFLVSLVFCPFPFPFWPIYIKIYIYIYLCTLNPLFLWPVNCVKCVRLCVCLCVSPITSWLIWANWV